MRIQVPGTHSVLLVPKLPKKERLLAGHCLFSQLPSICYAALLLSPSTENHKTGWLPKALLALQPMASLPQDQAVAYPSHS